jgi:hypothetical protein
MGGLETETSPLETGTLDEVVVEGAVSVSAVEFTMCWVVTVAEVAPLGTSTCTVVDMGAGGTDGPLQ